MVDRADPQIFVCPACSYDVEPSLDADAEVCPECGGAISRETCAVDEELRSVRSLVINYSIAIGFTWMLAWIPLILRNYYDMLDAHLFLAGVCVVAGLVLVVVGGRHAHRASGFRRGFHGGTIGGLDRLVGKVLLVLLGGVAAFLMTLFVVGSVATTVFTFYR